MVVSDLLWENCLDFGSDIFFDYPNTRFHSCFYFIFYLYLSLVMVDLINMVSIIFLLRLCRHQVLFHLLRYQGICYFYLYIDLHGYFVILWDIHSMGHCNTCFSFYPTPSLYLHLCLDFLYVSHNLDLYHIVYFSNPYLKVSHLVDNLQDYRSLYFLYDIDHLYYMFLTCFVSIRLDYDYYVNHVDMAHLFYFFCILLLFKATALGLNYEENNCMDGLVEFNLLIMINLNVYFCMGSRLYILFNFIIKFIILTFDHFLSNRVISITSCNFSCVEDGYLYLQVRHPLHSHNLNQLFPYMVVDSLSFLKELMF